ncbi:MAG: ABC transporter ATP-binding protein [Lachnospiraceae bacterium]
MRNKFKNFFELVNKLKPFIRPYKWKFFSAIIMIVISVAAMTAAPSIEGMITTQLANDAAEMLANVEGAGVQFNIVIRILILLFIVYIIKTTSQIFGSFFLTDSIQNTMHDVRNAVQDKIRRLPVKYFDTHSFGDTLSRVTNDVETVSNALQQSFTEVIRGILTILLALIMMYSIKPVLACLALLIIPLSIFISRCVVKHSQGHFKAQQDSLGDLNGAITELYSGYNELILYGRQQESIQQFETINTKLQRHAFKAQFMSSLMSPLISLVTYLSIGAAGVCGCFFVISGGMTVGGLQAFIRYIWQINDPLSQVSQLSTQIQSAFAALKRIFEILDAEEEIPDTVEPKQIKDVKGKVTFENVSFGYTDKTIIKNLNITVEPGQMVAIVGPTGAGKTTIINLLLRFYDVKEGRILIDGVDIKDMKREDLRSLFGMVLQDTWLFFGTIFENIRYGKRNARKDQVIDAAKLRMYITMELPGGYDMKINEEGNNISLGEKQLLTIARAILKDPKILILDEATSSVDTRLEKILQNAMHKVMEGRTSFVIAHRLSTIKNADMIMVLKEGSIEEIGTHQELIDKKGYYEQLYNAQFSWQEN